MNILKGAAIIYVMVLVVVGAMLKPKDVHDK